MIIRDVELLAENLGQSFVLLVGSAVSGAGVPRVPKVQPAIRAILRRVSARLEQGRYIDWLLARYASSLVEGRYKGIRKTTKFEEFLWRIERAAGRAALDELLVRLYVCDRDEYGPNQSAIAWLLKERVSTACLTTNLDNALERASPGMRTLHHPSYLKALPGANQPPVLAKLHGDARTRTCVATSPALSDAKRLEEHRYLRDLLAGQTILVLGYSGFGDIDISPHLALPDARFLWGVRKRDSRTPRFVRSRVLCDLKSLDPKRNLLLALASRHGWQPSSEGRVHEWREGLDQWCNSLDTGELREVVFSMLEGGAGWNVMQVFDCTRATNDVDAAYLSYGDACLNVAAYESAGQYFKEALASNSLSEMERIRLLSRLGFTQWRHGDLGDALRTLSMFTELNDERRPIEDRYEISLGLRWYLQVARDWMQYRRSSRDRTDFFEERNIAAAIDTLQELPQPSDRDRILVRAIALDIRRLTGDRVDVAEVRGLYDEACDLMEWGTAQSVGRVLIKLSLWDGMRALARADRRLLRRRQLNTIRKSIAARLYCLLGGQVPLVLSLLDGPLLMPQKTAWVEWRYRRKARKWAKDRERGKARLE